MLGPVPEDLALAVCGQVAETLNLPLHRVRLDSLLMHDLGMDSLGLLEILMRLEVHFQIQIPRGGLELAARGDLTREQFAPRGVLSPLACERLRSLLPDVAARIQPGLRVRDIPTLYTVGALARLVALQLIGDP